MTVLYIILGIVILFVGLLSIPVFVNLEYTDSTKCSVSWLFLKFTLYPREKKTKKETEKKPKEEKKEEEPKKEETKEQKPKKQNPLKTFYNNEGVSGVAELLGNCIRILNKFSKGFIKSIIVRKFWLSVSVTEGDAAQTAIKYGKICAYFYPSLGFICSNMKVKDYKVNIYANYIGERTDCNFITEVGIVPRAVINAGIAFAFRLIGQFIKLIISNIKHQNSNTKGGKTQ